MKLSMRYFCRLKVDKYLCYTFFIVLTMVFMRPLHAQSYINSTHIPVFHQQFDQPASVGSQDEIRIFGAFRYQWIGVEGAPMTTYLGADMPLPLKNVSGGVFVAHDRLGASYYTQFHTSFSYKIPIGENSINLGLKVGVMNTTLDGSKLTTPDINLGIDDPSLSFNKESGIRPELGIGVAYHHQYFNIGAFVNNIGDFKTKINGLDQESEFNYGRYLGVNARAEVPISANFSLSPSVLLKTNTIHHQIDLSLSTIYKEKYSFGIGYRGYNKLSSESLILISKINIIQGLSLMYSYDLLLNRIKLSSSGSHEVSLGYVFPKKYVSNKSKIINHPRYL